MSKRQIIHSMYAGWTDGPKYTLLQTTSDIDLMNEAMLHHDSNLIIGNPEELTEWIRNFDKNVGTVYIDVDDETFDSVKDLKPQLHIKQVDLG